ncbi:hypothetical protein GIB67_014881 [Kingdonia uniflora]|uniref:Uncharacterized protein n=1 Tax=Kingdonia uniflora TaxID=39325 RepID=A0A7J7MTD5_9MAGN|nr:hypothetical protein GIB67_014881 [Kingdonia uniflora]
MVEDGREGDWECGVCVYLSCFLATCCVGCVLVVGNGSIGCSNNNYVSRDLCKKCGEPKEIAAMPALGMPEASLPTYSHYFAKAQGTMGVRINLLYIREQCFSNRQICHCLKDKEGLGFNDMSLRFEKLEISYWFDRFGALATAEENGVYYSRTDSDNEICYGDGRWESSMTIVGNIIVIKCKKCNASMLSTTPSAANPSAKHMISSKSGMSSKADNLLFFLLPETHGTKRLASDEFITEWDNKWLNAGDISHHFWLMEQSDWRKMNLLRNGITRG